MRFFPVLFAATAFAGHIVQRQASIVADALTSVADATTNFQNALNAYQPGDGTSGGLLDAVDALIDAINAANTQVIPAEPFDLNAAIPLLEPVENLADVADATITALIERKDLFTTDCVAVIARDRLTETFAAVRTFEDTVYTKLDADATTVAKDYIDDINEDFQRGVDAYADASLPASCGSSSTTTTTTTSGTETPVTTATTTTTTSGTETPVTTATTATTTSGTETSATTATTTITTSNTETPATTSTSTTISSGTGAPTTTTTTSSSTRNTTGGPGPTTTRTVPPIYTGAAATMFVNYGAAAVVVAAVAAL